MAERKNRLWPMAALVVVLWLLRLVGPSISAEMGMVAMMAGPLVWLLVVLWWVIFSGATGRERWVPPVLMVAGIFVTRYLVHTSIGTAMMGMMLPFFALPFVTTTFVVWACARHLLAPGPRRTAMVLAIAIPILAWTLLRTGGFDSEGNHDFAWRWTETHEDVLVAAGPIEATAAAGAVADPGFEWPGFRGPQRNGRLAGVTIETDWAASPPARLWERPIGPGWSSFAVRGDRFYTQEQRGEDELVVCYSLATGEPIWTHSDRARFWEANAGAGPRATPTLSGDRVYALGATGILNALDASTGSVLWSRNPATETDTKLPGWAFSGSPLVVDGVVIVAVSGRLAGYDAETGEPRWTGGNGRGSYSSPHPADIDGVSQVLMVDRAGVVSHRPSDGAQLWEYAWEGGSRIVQPAVLSGDDLLVSEGERKGLRRLAVAKADDTWQLEERWTTHRIKPYFSDFVVHEGHVYGVDGSILTCIDLESGERKWKGGRYGSGQLLLLPDQDLLLMVSEKGDLVLVSATPDRHTEIARAPGIEGKTWNHPVLAGDVLLVRNAEEMAAFRVALARQS